MQDPEAAVAGPSLEDSSSLIEKALMLYMNNFFTISATRSLEFSDLGNISRQDASATGGFDSHFINIKYMSSLEALLFYAMQLFQCQVNIY